MKEERYGERDLCFSGWHRYQLNKSLTMTDLDCVEYCQRCNKPLALIELAYDVGQDKKWTRPIQELAKMAELPAYLVFYKGNSTAIRAAMCFCTTGVLKRALLKLAHVHSLRIRRVSPTKSKEVVLTPGQYELFLILLRVRSGHACYKSVAFDWWNNSENPDSVKELFE